MAVHLPDGSRGSFRPFVRSAQAAAATYSYDSWGNTTSSGAQAATNPWTYAGGYNDTTSNRIKFGARYYNPFRGRFTQVDPSGQEANRYTYVGCNPINATDPTGLDAFDCALGIGGAVAGLAVFGGSIFTAPETLGGSLLIGGAALGDLVLSGQAARACGFI
jgi:RHS repeat-associated protein